MGIIRGGRARRRVARLGGGGGSGSGCGGGRRAFSRCRAYLLCLVLRGIFCGALRGVRHGVGRQHGPRGRRIGIGGRGCAVWLRHVGLHTGWLGRLGRTGSRGPAGLGGLSCVRGGHEVHRAGCDVRG